MSGGVVVGTGTNSTITNNGCTIAPGHSPGTLTIDGDLVFNSGLLQIEIAGLGIGQFDVLDVLGNVMFAGGTIEFDFLNGFVPSMDDMIPFLLGNSITGLDHLAFTSHGLPAGTSFNVTIGLDGALGFVAGDAATTPDVPEPRTLVLLLVGLTALAVVRTRRVGLVHARIGSAGGGSSSRRI